MEKLSNIPALSRKQFGETMLVLIIAELADAICGVIDGIVVGHYLGEDAMAAHGIATPIFVLLTIFSYMITVGFQQPCTVYIGRGEPQKANGLFSATMFYTIVVAVLFSVTGQLFPRSFAHMMGAPSVGVIADMSTDYLRAVFMGTPFLLIFLSLIPVLQIDGERKLVHAGSVVMAVSDIIIDILNVKVFHGGMWGIGMATTISYFLGMMVLLTYFLRKSRLFHLRPQDIAGSRPGQIFRMGLPAGARVAARSVAIISLNTLVMGTAGATAMAAFSVQHNLSTLLLSVAIGISAATLLLSGISYGEQDRRGLMDLVRMSAYSCILIMGLLAVLVFSLARPLVSLYLSPLDEAYPLAVHAVRWLAVAMPLMAWSRCLGCYEQGVGRNRTAIWIFLSEELLSLVTCASILGWIWGIEGVFASFAVSQLLVIVSMNLYFYFRRDKRYKGMEAFLDVPEDFGVPPENRLMRTLERPEEVWALAEQAQSFCTDRGLAADKAYLVSMYIEEMGNIIMIYGFNDGKPHHLEIRLSLYMDQAILHFRDDCRRFDITERASHWKEDPEHPETTLGVRMVMSACALMRYDNSMSTNNLIVLI
jgi:putative MATE family efflux protein